MSISIVGGKKMNFEKWFCFDGESMSNSSYYYTGDKSKLSDDQTCAASQKVKSRQSHDFDSRIKNERNTVCISKFYMDRFFKTILKNIPHFFPKFKNGLN
jgi:hypothetical protein